MPWANAWFDCVPRMTIIVGARSLPAFRSMGIIGFHLGFVAAILAAIRIELSLLVAVGLSSTAALSFFGWGLLRRAVAGGEYLVLLEHVWVAMAAVAGYLWLAEAPVLTGLDVLVVGLGVFLALGRIGCFTVGCCHGTPAPTGIRYDSNHDHVLPWLIGRRLRPVPLIEAAGLLVIFVISVMLVTAEPGTATAWFLASYAVLRFGTEALRGDERPMVGSTSVARIMSVIQLGGAVWLAEYVNTGALDVGLAPADDQTWLAPAVRVAPVVVVLVAGLALNQVRKPNPLTTMDHLRTCWQLITENAGGQSAPTLATTDQALTLGVSAIGPSTAHVSMHHRDLDTTAIANCFGATDIATRNGITHTSIVLPQPLPRPSNDPAEPTPPAPQAPQASILGPKSEDYFTSSAMS